MKEILPEKCTSARIPMLPSFASQNITSFLPIESLSQLSNFTVVADATLHAVDALGLCLIECGFFSFLFRYGALDSSGWSIESPATDPARFDEH